MEEQKQNSVGKQELGFSSEESQAMVSEGWEDFYEKYLKPDLSRRGLAESDPEYLETTKHLHFVFEKLVAAFVENELVMSRLPHYKSDEIEGQYKPHPSLTSAALNVSKKIRGII